MWIYALGVTLGQTLPLQPLVDNVIMDNKQQLCSSSGSDGKLKEDYNQNDRQQTAAASSGAATNGRAKSDRRTNGSGKCALWVGFLMEGQDK